MTISNRIDLLADQAVRRIEQLGMDPRESIRRALVYATTEVEALSDRQQKLSAPRREVVQLLQGGPLTLRQIARRLGLTLPAAKDRLYRLRRGGFVYCTGHRLWSLWSRNRLADEVMV